MYRSLFIRRCLLHESLVPLHHSSEGFVSLFSAFVRERWGAGVESHKNVRGEIGGWGRVPFNETYAPSLSTIYDGA